MENIFEVKATNINEAIEIVKKNNKIDEFHIIEAVEKEKGKSIINFFNKRTTYMVYVKEKIEKKIMDKIKKIIELMGLELKVEIKKSENNLVMINLNGRDNGIIIGKKGKTLSNLEYLINTIFSEVKIEIDVENFKKNREETLISLSKKIAEKVIKTQKAVKLNPMPPNERKIIHSVLNNYENIETHSEGKDPNRYIIVKLKKQQN